MPQTPRYKNHTSASSNDKQNSTIEALRTQIDAIDAEIAELLIRRIGLVTRVGKIKKAENCQQSYIRPRREAMMLRDLVNRFEGVSFPRAAIAAIWRTIIGASTVAESPLNLSVYCRTEDKTPYFLAREYFGSFVPCQIHHDFPSVLADMQKNQHTVGIVTREVETSETPSWWEALAALPEAATTPLVFAIIPFLRSRFDTSPLPTTLALGRVELLPTGEDETLFVFTTDKPARADDWAAWYGQSLAAVALHQAGHKVSASRKAGLFGVQGFHHNDPEKLTALLAALAKASGGRITGGRCIGAYASAMRTATTKDKPSGRK